MGNDLMENDLIYKMTDMCPPLYSLTTPDRWDFDLNKLKTMSRDEISELYAICRDIWDESCHLNPGRK